MTLPRIVFFLPEDFGVRKFLSVSILTDSNLEAHLLDSMYGFVVLFDDGAGFWLILAEYFSDRN